MQKKLVFSQVVYCSVQQESRFWQVMMRKILCKLHCSCSARKILCHEVVTSVQENAEDIYAEAQQINEEREAKAAVVEDEEVTETAEETEETEEEDFTEA